MWSTRERVSNPASPSARARARWSGRRVIRVQNADSAEVGRKATPHAGDSGCLAEVPGHLAVPGAHLQLRGHHSADAGGGQEIRPRRRILEIAHVPGGEFHPQRLSPTGPWGARQMPLRLETWK